MKQNNETTNKKSLKERLADNKGKIIAGVGVITIGTLGYLLYQDRKNIKLLNEAIKDQAKFDSSVTELAKTQRDVMFKQAEQLKITKDIAKEGALEEAMKSINRKIQYRVGKIESLSNKGLDETALIAKETYERELKELYKKKASFEYEWDNMIH